AVDEVDLDGVAVVEPALEQRHREPVAEAALDDPLERPGPEGGVVALVGEVGRRRRRDLEDDAALGEAVAEAVELDLDDLADVVLAELAEPHDVVDPVDELRL